MKRYILLRNNKEFGPYTLRELREVGLCPTDLIWVESESNSWEHPTLIQELKAIAAEGIKQPLLQEPETGPNETVSSLEVYLAAASQSAAEENDFASILERPRKRSIMVTANFFGLVLLLVGVMLVAFTVKKMIDGFDDMPVSYTEAKEIKAETLSSGATAHLAKQNLNVEPAPAVLSNIKKDSSQSSVVVKKTVAAPANVLVAGLASSGSSPNETNGTKAISANTEEDSNAENAEEKPKAEEKPVVVPAPDKTPSLQLSANDYKVGILGGISDLELSISNPSSQVVEKAIVEVEYLKPNGSVVKSQTLAVENIAAGGTKKIAVPSNSRGVKVRYHVVSVDVKNDKVVITNS